MSLGQTWVLFDDGAIHADPIIAAAPDGNWFICFDEDDPPELVLFEPGANKDRAVALLHEHSIAAKVLQRTGAGHGSLRAHLPHGGGSFNMQPAASFDLKLLRPPPARLIVEEDEEPKPLQSGKLPDFRGTCWHKFSGG